MAGWSGLSGSVNRQIIWRLVATLNGAVRDAVRDASTTLRGAHGLVCARQAVPCSVASSQIHDK